MSTGDQYFNATPKRILGVQDFRERLLDYTRKALADINATSFGLDGVFNGPISISAFGANKIQLATDGKWSDGNGHFLITDALLAGRDIGLQFENTNAVVYGVGLHFAERPRSIQINPRTGFPEFVAWEESIGDRASPTAVVDNGDGTMTFTVNSVADPFGNLRTYAGRRCLVWKKIPGRNATTDASAVELCIVAFTGGNNKITTSLVGGGGAGTFGQTAGSVSTTASDYYVMMLGPTIVRNSERNLQIEPAYAWVGTVTGNAGTPTVFSSAGQNQLGSGFAADLTAITQLLNSDLKIRVGAVALDNNTPQLEVDDAGNIPVWTVDESGDTFIGGTLAVTGASNFTGLLTAVNLTTTGNAHLGNAEADQHEIRGRVQQKLDTNAVITELLASGELGLGGAAVAATILRALGSTDLGLADGTSTAKVRGLLKAADASNAIKAVLDGITGKMVLNGTAVTSKQLQVNGTSAITKALGLGDDLNVGTAAEAESTRVDFGELNALSRYQCLLKWKGQANSIWRLYARVDRGFALTSNALYDPIGQTFSKDISGNSALEIEFKYPGFNAASPGLKLRTRDAGNNAAWAYDAGWDHTVVDWNIGVGAPGYGVLSTTDAMIVRNFQSTGGIESDALLQTLDLLVAGTLQSDITPDGDSTRNLGTAGARFAALYGNQVVGNEFVWATLRQGRENIDPSAWNRDTTVGATALSQIIAPIAGGDPEQARLSSTPAGAAVSHYFRAGINRAPRGSLLTGIEINFQMTPDDANIAWTISVERIPRDGSVGASLVSVPFALTHDTLRHTQVVACNQNNIVDNDLYVYRVLVKALSAAAGTATMFIYNTSALFLSSKAQS